MSGNSLITGLYIFIVSFLLVQYERLSYPLNILRGVFVLSRAFRRTRAFESRCAVVSIFVLFFLNIITNHFFFFL